MNVLIIESNAKLAQLWGNHLGRQGHIVVSANSAETAMKSLHGGEFDVILINYLLEGGGALGVADYARLRHPSTNQVFVTSSSFFSDGSIYDFVPSARTVVRSAIDPTDLTAIVEYYGTHS